MGQLYEIMYWGWWQTNTMGMLQDAVMYRLMQKQTCYARKIMIIPPGDWGAQTQGKCWQIDHRSSLFISNTVVMTKVFKSMILTRCDLHGRPTAWCLYIQWYWAPAVTGCSVPAVLPVASPLIRPTLSTGHLLVLTLIQSLCSYISQSPCTFTPSIYLCMELIFQPQQ